MGTGGCALVARRGDVLAYLQSFSIGALLHIAFLAFTLPRILSVKRDPLRALTWLYFCLLVPYLGCLLFWMIGDPSVRRHTVRVIEGPPIFRASRRRARPSLRVVVQTKLQRLQARLGESPATRGNHVEFYDDGKTAFDAIEAAMRDAQHEICVQYYIYRDDEIGRRLAKIMRQKAQKGVRVYFLYDAIGSVGLSEGFLHWMRRAGVELHPFLPFGLLVRRLQINFRNHRKLVIVDNKIAFTGGLNVGMEYIHGTRRLGEWYDIHLRVTGPCVPQFREEYEADWFFTAEDMETTFVHIPAPELDEEETAVPLDQNRGWVQTVSGGPDQKVNRIRSLLHFAISRARRRIWIATPYLVPDEAIHSALVSAAYAGIDVRILVQNNKPDQWLPQMAARYFWEEFMDAGVRLYQYTPGMMHTKMLVMDDDIATVGSANLDVRSLSLNFEMNLVFYSRYEIKRTEDLFEAAFARSIEVGDAFRKRGRTVRVVENFSRLFAPTL
jgi:cardiolipin synthase